MQKINISKLNKSNADIWGILYKALESKNIALIEVTLVRLYKSQKYTLELLEFQDADIVSLNHHLANAHKTSNEFEKEWFSIIAKNTNVYEKVRDSINQTF